MLRHTVGQQRGDALFVVSEVLVVVRPQLHYVVVGRQKPTGGALADVLLTFALQRLCRFLGDAVATEHPRAGVATDILQLAVQPLANAHGYLLPRVLLARSYPGTASRTAGCANRPSHPC